jgi:hypothetical protein
MLILSRSAIQVDEIQCVHLWNAFLGEMVLEGQKGMDPSRLKSIETIIQVRDFYFSRCQYLWKILQEIIRIDGDKSHVYHEPISRYLDKLLEKYPAFYECHFTFLIEAWYHLSYYRWKSFIIGIITLQMFVF